MGTSKGLSRRLDALEQQAHDAIPRMVREIVDEACRGEPRLDREALFHEAMAEVASALEEVSRLRAAGASERAIIAHMAATTGQTVEAYERQMALDLERWPYFSGGPGR